MMLYDVHDVFTNICTSKSHKTLVSGLHGVSQVSTLLSVVGLKTCPINSNRVLRSSISLDRFHCSLFWFNHLTSDQKISRKQPSMSVVSSIYQLRTAPKPIISLPLIRPRWSSKVLRVHQCFMTSLSGPVFSLIDSKATDTHKYVTLTQLLLQPCMQTPHNSVIVYFYLPKRCPQIRVQDLKQTQARNQNVNHTNQTR